MTALESFFALKITPSAKLVALHFAGTLDPDAKEIPSSPKVCAERLGISRGEYERAWRECCKRKWIVGHSPTKLTMPADSFPRLVLAEMAGHDAPAPLVLTPPSRQEESNEERSRNHGSKAAGSLRRGQTQGTR